MRHPVKKVLEISQIQFFFYLHISINYFVKFTTYKHLGVVWMKGVLDDMIQNSSLIIQNWWDPRKNFCLDSITLFWSLCFGDSSLKNLSDEA